MRHYGLIGLPLAHSFSQTWFTDKFRKENIEARYENYPLQTIRELPELIQRENLLGLNVTHPYKKQVLNYVNHLDEEAEAIGAVNTLRISADGIQGHNTDAYGFRQSLKPFLEGYMERALILGTGGAASAVSYVLKQLGVDVVFVSRTKKGDKILNWNELTPLIIQHFFLIVNCTPVGTFPKVNEKPPLPYDALTEKHLLYDLVYNPQETAFLKEGKLRGSKLLNGLDMLKLQALRSWEIWNH